MEALYMKLYEKYTRLKNRKDSELDQVNQEQEAKFINYTIAADNLIEHLNSEIDRLKKELDELRNEFVALRSANDQQYAADYEKLLTEERQKNQLLCVEIRRLEDLHPQELRSRGATDQNDDQQLSSTPLCSEIIAPESKSNRPMRTSRKRHRLPKPLEGIVRNESVLNQVDHPTARDVSADVSIETTSGVDLHQPECCRRNINDGGPGNCIFHSLLESLTGMKMIVVNESEGLSISSVHQSSGYSFSLTWIQNAPTGKVELLYRLSTLGTFEKVAPEWMREEALMFSLSMYPIFLNRLSSFIKHH